MSKCTDRGCRNLEWKCADCGRLASTATIANPSGYGEWISIKDRMPQDGSRVLVLFKYKTKPMAVAFYCDNLCTIYKQYNYGVFVLELISKIKIPRQLFDQFHVEKNRISHWMYLPEPPQ